jgi:glucose/arabinose dehydrogenase
VFRRLSLPLLIVLAALLSLQQVEGVHGTVPVNFVRGTVTGAGFATSLPTTLTLGPDGRLYVADQNGRIQALTLDANKNVTAVQQLTTNTDLQEVYGITFDPADPSSIYVTNTSSGFGDVGQAPAGTFLGKVTRLSGVNFATRTDIITGLPVNNSGHEANGLAFGPDGRLYVGQGATTNGGLVNPNVGLFQRPEVPTSGAILVADIKAPGFNGNITYNPPNTYSDTVDQVSGDVSAYAVGLRNPYDIVFHSNGKLYNTDNGANSGYGPPSTGCTTQGTTDAAALDELNIIVAGNYYGHPNRNRGRTDPRQCVWHPGTDPSGSGYTAPIEANLPASSDGLAEYTSARFGGQMQGDLLYVSWVENTLHRVKLSADGLSVVSDTTLATALQNALDVAVAPDGTIFVAEYGANRITYFKPDETPVSTVTVTGISPNAGTLAGGQAVTITGSNFTTTAETTATIGGLALSNMVVQNSTTITGITPPSTAGLKDVVVTNSIGTGTLTNGYNYAAGGGTIPPVANAGPDLSTPIAHENHAHVTIDGRASYDPDGAIVSYEWREGTTVLSTNPVDSVQLLQGEHLLTLTVTDNDGYTDSDDVRIIVTATAENPEPYWCMDINGDTAVNSGDQGLVDSSFGKRFGQSGYSRLKDFNGDRVINSGDQGKLANQQIVWLSKQCPLVDQQIRAATKGMEDAGYENINNAFAAGYYQVTPFIPGQGRHLVKGTLGTQDTVFEPDKPESLLYEPDPNTPGGWRLGGAMYIIPYDKTIPEGGTSGIPPDGFATNEDSWHYHDDLCLWNNFASVQEGVAQATCMARSGNPVWIPRAGWLVHLWNFVPNPVGRFVEVNNKFFGNP